MRTIAIDCRFAASTSGLGRYTRELVSRMIRSNDARFVLVASEARPAWLDVSFSHAVVQADIPHYSLQEQVLLPRIIRQTHADLLFVPHFNVPLFSGVPYVMTVHDLILHYFPNRSSLCKQIAYRTQIRLAVRRARSVITVSRFVSEELRERYGNEIASKTTVIGEGVDASYQPCSSPEQQRVMKMYGLRLPYFLYVGSAKEHKNVRTLIDAYSLARASGTELVLVTGGKEVVDLGPLPNGVRTLSNVPDGDLPALYCAAKAFVTASLYEGYGLPVAEALACGCPVIASNRGAIPEVAHGHALLIEPSVEAFSRALNHPPARVVSFRAGSWDEAAQKTLALLLQ